MTKFMQINLRAMGSAYNLALQTARMWDVDILIISEPARGPPDDDRRHSSTDGKCKVILTERANMAVIESTSGPGFVSVFTGEFIVYSCYFSPNTTMAEYAQLLDGLERDVRGRPEARMIIAGDFNAKATEWGSTRRDRRGDMLLELAAGLGLTVANEGSSPTFRGRAGESVIDVTLFRAIGPGTLSEWTTHQTYTDSDHVYITFLLTVSPDRAGTNGTVTRNAWATTKLDARRLSGFLAEKREGRNRDWLGEDPDIAAERFGQHIAAACDEAMPRRPMRTARRPMYWWTEEIAGLRRACNRWRRAYQRAGPRGEDRTAERASYIRAKKELRKAIRSSQEKAWRKLTESVEADPWGLAYRLVAKKLSRHPPGAEAKGREREIARELFPIADPPSWDEVPYAGRLGDRSEAEPPLFTTEELNTAALRMPAGKAPGPDGIPNEALKIVVREDPEAVLTLMNACLKEMRFPERWKVARLVLLHKGAGRPIIGASNFRPICLIDNIAKLLERLVLARLDRAITDSGGLSDHQYGFRKGRGAVHAINSILETVNIAKSGAGREGRLCLLVTLDVKNAFNTAPWRAVDCALRGRRIPRYLVRLARSYLEGREILVPGETEERMTVHAGVPQGSVLGPALWNVFYDGVLGLELPQGSRLIGFADDLALLVTGSTTRDLEEKANEGLATVGEWMEANGLQLAPNKSEAMMLGRRKKGPVPNVVLNGQTVTVPEGGIRYLGVTLDPAGTFRRHLAEAATRAAKAAAAVARLMPNMGGPSATKRALLQTVATSRLLYAAPVWAEQASRYRCNREALMRAQRLSALRIIRAYRTTSGAAALVIAGSLPADLMAEERLEWHRRKMTADQTEEGTTEWKRNRRERSVAEWQRRWEEDTETAEWTRRVLPDIRRWLKRMPGLTVTFHLTQTLTGHGCFRAYLNERGRADDPNCLWCPGVREGVEHTLFDCQKFERHRSKMTEILGERPLPEHTQGILCGEGDVSLIRNATLRINITAEAERRRTAWTEMVEGILKEKEEDERNRQADGRAAAVAAVRRVAAGRRAGGRGAIQRRGRRGVAATD